MILKYIGIGILAIIAATILVGIIITIVQKGIVLLKSTTMFLLCLASAASMLATIIAPLIVLFGLYCSLCVQTIDLKGIGVTFLLVLAVAMLGVLLAGVRHLWKCPQTDLFGELVPASWILMIGSVIVFITCMYRAVKVRQWHAFLSFYFPGCLIICALIAISGMGLYRLASKSTGEYRPKYLQLPRYTGEIIRGYGAIILFVPRIIGDIAGPLDTGTSYVSSYDDSNNYNAQKENEDAYNRYQKSVEEELELRHQRYYDDLYYNNGNSW